MQWHDVITKPKKEGGLGIRSMRQAKSAFLAKLGWRLLAEPQSFMVSCAQKYVL